MEVPMKMAVRGELWKKWLQCLSMTVLKQNGSGLGWNRWLAVLPVSIVSQQDGAVSRIW